MRPIGRITIGFHGCGDVFATDAVTCRETLRPGKKKYHWLGSGIYFWEEDQVRALEWAKEKAARGELKSQKPTVIGGILELGNCLDISVRDNISLVKAAHESLTTLYEKSGDPMPSVPELNDEPDTVTVLANLVRQITMSDYRDSLGHDLRMNVAYLEAVALLTLRGDAAGRN